MAFKRSPRIKIYPWIPAAGIVAFITCLLLTLPLRDQQRQALSDLSNASPASPSQLGGLQDQRDPALPNARTIRSGPKQDTHHSFRLQDEHTDEHGESGRYCRGDDSHDAGPCSPDVFLLTDEHQHDADFLGVETSWRVIYEDLVVSSLIPPSGGEQVEKRGLSSIFGDDAGRKKGKGSGTSNGVTKPNGVSKPPPGRAPKDPKQDKPKQKRPPKGDPQEQQPQGQQPQAGQTVPQEPTNEPGYKVELVGGESIRIPSAPYPSKGELYLTGAAPQVIRQAYRLKADPRVLPALQLVNIEAGRKPAGLDDIESEHPLDRQIAAQFLQTANSGLLGSSKKRPSDPKLKPVPTSFFTDYWLKELPGLAGYPGIGATTSKPGQTVRKPRPANWLLIPNYRLMVAFGTRQFRLPFLPTDAAINGAKAKLMLKQDVIKKADINKLAQVAARTDSMDASNELFSKIRVMFALFEYLRDPSYAERLNVVRTEIAEQLGYIDKAYKASHGVDLNLQAWWKLFIENYLLEVEALAKTYTSSILKATLNTFDEAEKGSSKLKTYKDNVSILTKWTAKVQAQPSLFKFPAYEKTDWKEDKAGST